MLLKVTNVPLSIFPFSRSDVEVVAVVNFHFTASSAAKKTKSKFYDWIQTPSYRFSQLRLSPEKTAVIYRRKTIRGNMLLNVVAVAHQQATVTSSSSSLSGMCAFSDVARIQFSSFALSLDISALQFRYRSIFDDVELDGGKKKMLRMRTKLTHTHTINICDCVKSEKILPRLFYIAELKVFFFRIHRNTRISAIFSLQICLFSASVLKRCQNWHERRSKSNCVARKIFSCIFFSCFSTSIILQICLIEFLK